MDFEDPLATYRVLARHPSSEGESQVSSAPDDPEDYKDLCGKVDNILKEYHPVVPEDDTPFLFRSFLRYLCKDGQTTLMNEIVQFATYPASLRMLRNFLVDAILKPMTIAGGKNPKTIESTPFKDASQDIQLLMTQIQPSSRNDQTLLKQECLQRDGYQCLVTGLVDLHSTQDQGERRLREGEMSATTECAHILPFALRKFNENSAKETEAKATIWWALYRYFPFLNGKIGPETINQHENAMTLWIDFHQEFGRYESALEPMDTEHKYRTHTVNVGTLASKLVSTTITMKQLDTSKPMPDPDFLRVHFQIFMILKKGLGFKPEIIKEP